MLSKSIMSNNQIFISIMMVTLIITMAGCSTGVTDQTPTETNTATETQTDKALPTVEPSDRLVIHSDTSKNITVAMYEYTGEGYSPDTIKDRSDKWKKVDSVSYVNKTGRFRVTELEINGHIAISVNDELVWEAPISVSDHVELVISQDGEVTVTERTAT